ncbi:unnamed protein product, partial [Ectocarpus sp. 12 AP-2014]
NTCVLCECHVRTKELTTSTCKRYCTKFHTHRTDNELGHLCGTDHHGTNTSQRSPMSHLSIARDAPFEIGLSSICRDLISPVRVLRFRGKCSPSRMPNSCGLILVWSPARITHPPALLRGILSLQHTPNPQQWCALFRLALPLTSRTSPANNSEYSGPFSSPEAPLRG